jgi:hypothetical protein
MALRIELVFALTTNPVDRESASPHSGGWTESIWYNNAFNSVVLGYIATLAQKRAALLPLTAEIIGYRIQEFTASVNRLIPGGSSSGAFRYPGNASFPGDLPQVSLQLKGSAVGTSNSRRWSLRGMPDSMMTGGEYQPTAPYKGLMTQYLNYISNNNWQFPARDLTQPNMRVLTIANGVLTVDAVQNIVVGGYVRLHRVKDTAGKKVVGVYRVLAIVGTALTLLGMPTTTAVMNSGTCRNDLLVFPTIGPSVPQRAVIKKVGRPFESYRGRASKR